MPTKYRRDQKSKVAVKKPILYCGKSYTLEDAAAFALVEFEEGRLQVAAEVYSLIIAETPKLAMSYCNRGVILYVMQQYNNAIASFDAALDLEPDNIAAHLHRGAALEEIGRLDEALVSYDKAISLEPHNSIANIIQRGSLLHAMGRFDEALASYDRAVETDANNVDAHAGRAGLLHQLERYEEAAECLRRLIEIDPGNRPGYLNRLGVIAYNCGRHDEALNYYYDGRAADSNRPDIYLNEGMALKALERYEDALACFGKAIDVDRESDRTVDCLNARGSLLFEMGRHDAAMDDFEQAFQLVANSSRPRHDKIRTLSIVLNVQDAVLEADRGLFSVGCIRAATFLMRRGVVLRELQQYDEALESFDKALTLCPDSDGAMVGRSMVLQSLQLIDEALAACDAAISINPTNAGAYFNRGVNLIVKGDLGGAKTAFKNALEILPAYPDALFYMTTIRKFRSIDDPEAALIRNLLPSVSESEDGGEPLLFALGKIYDDCGKYDEAFEFIRQGNQIHHARTSYNPEIHAGRNRLIREVFGKEFLSQPHQFASTSHAPLFVVGMPRSGTTLMASMLSNHPLVGTAGELLEVDRMPMRIEKLCDNLAPYPLAARHISPEAALELTESYELRLRRDVGNDPIYVVDKMPINFLHLGLISLLFPNARVIHCNRDPLDTAISSYFARFGPYYDYSVDLMAFGHYYNEYLAIMSHWRDSLPTPMIEVSYENLVTEPEPILRRILDELGLNWDDQCLTPHTNQCYVQTVSHWQVRQPIYSSSAGRWRNYEKHLAPLRESLGI